MPTNDLQCSRCSRIEMDVFYRGAPPACPVCSDTRTVSWAHGHPPATDIAGTPRQYGEEIVASSNRDALAQMRRKAQVYNDSPEARAAGIQWDTQSIDIAGDKQGGARDETRAKQSAFGYAGQARRTSTGERLSRAT